MKNTPESVEKHECFEQNDGFSNLLAICSKHSCEKQHESLEKHECFEQNDGFANLLAILRDFRLYFRFDFWCSQPV